MVNNNNKREREKKWKYKTSDNNENCLKWELMIWKTGKEFPIFWQRERRE